MTDADAFRDAEYIADVSGISYDDAEPPRPTGTLSSQNACVKKVNAAAKVAFIDRLMRDLDIFVYCQLSALYYMDCSFPLFAIRAAVQSVLFTPKAPPFEPRRNQPFINGIILSNLICMLFHVFFIHPEAGEETRGYLNGGLFIDLIGQHPVSVLRLLSFDLLIFFVDIILLALTIERVNILGSSTPASPEPASTSNANTDQGTAEYQSQDHDAEERGVLRQEDGDEAIPSTHESVASSPNSIVDAEVDEERANLLADPTDIESPILARGGHPMDTFAAGEAVVVNARFFGTLVDQWRYSRDLVRQTPAFPPAETATFLRQRFGLQVGADGRFERTDT
ncbi:hypothetical protein N7541_005075 [Penicillium brevicompactum]|uniref:DUF1746 domain-containing protein n=1 Tax=Penicillium brevicompactum TaxID=5074 RepID=A0A9W9RDC3_PENBR|nr:hypothetical protein N7541_005075 [Penicillium brevicompactum]